MIKKEVTEVFGEIAPDEYQIVESGIYEAKFTRYETAYIHRAPKLILSFSITSYGDNFGVKISKFYNVRKLLGGKGKKGRFLIGRRSNFLHDFYRLFPDSHAKRLDRVPMSIFKNFLFEIEVRRVTTDYMQRNIPEQLQYSVISNIRRIVS